VRHVTAGGQRRRVGLVLLEDLDDRLLRPRPVEPRPIEQRRSVGEVVGPEHDVDVTSALDDQVTVLLRQAAAHRDLEVGTTLLQALQAPELAVQLVVSVLTHAARVEHDDVGLVDVVGVLHPVGDEQPGDPLGIVLVHLASERADVETAGLGHPRQSTEGPFGDQLRRQSFTTASTFCRLGVPWSSV
jgi:hypothetical protein